MFRGEEMSGRDSPQGSPVDSVGGEPDGPVEHQAVGRFFHRAVGENGAVENLLRHVRVTRHDDASLAEAESHEALGLASLGHGGDFAVG